MSNESFAEQSDDRYYTQIEAGDVRLFTVDQLDAAFNAGLIDEGTYVRLEGQSRWQTLGEVDPVISSAPHSIAPVVTAIPHFAPGGVDVDEQLETLLKRPKTGLKVLAGSAVLAVCALGFVLVQSASVDAPSPKIAEEAARRSGANVRQADPAPAMVDANGSSSSHAREKKDPSTELAVDAQEHEQKLGHERLTEETKEALRVSDSKRAAPKTKKASAAVHRAASKAGKAPGFKSGGSTYDPLNAKL
jgi:hypothetical protein